MANAGWYTYIRTIYQCHVCQMPLVQHAEGKCMFSPGTYFTIEEWVIRSLLQNEGEDTSTENVLRRKAVIEKDFHRGVL